MNKTILLCAIVFLFNYTTIVGYDNVDEQLLNRYTETIEKEVIHRGAIQIEMNAEQKLWDEKELGNIPLRKQVGPSCVTVSLAMYMDYLGYEYHSQEFYDTCANRAANEGTRLPQIMRCASSLGVKLEKNWGYRIDKLKTGDLVVLYYNNGLDTHMVVVDSINENTVRIADPNGYYTMYTKDEFEMIYTRQALVQV